MSEILFSCIINGRAIVKKNTQRVVGSGRSRRVIYSPKYLEWKCAAMTAINMALARHEIKHGTFKAIDLPMNLKVLFYFTNHSAEADLSNLYEGIQDLLQAQGVIANDRLIHGHDGSRKIFGQGERMEIEITELKQLIKRQA